MIRAYYVEAHRVNWQGDSLVEVAGKGVTLFIHYSRSMRFEGLAPSVRRICHGI